MSLTAQQLADLMPNATQLESNEPEMESSLHYAQLALLVRCHRSRRSIGRTVKSLGDRTRGLRIGVLTE